MPPCIQFQRISDLAIKTREQVTELKRGKKKERKKVFRNGVVGTLPRNKKRKGEGGGRGGAVAEGEKWRNGEFRVKV